MRHTYLFAEGAWDARGSYYDERCNPIPVEGKSVITHGEKYWINESCMKLAGVDSSQVENRYEIVPFNKDFTEWRSFNPSLGVLLGKFMVVDDTIISNFTSEDGVYTGVECLVKISDSRYLGRGFAFKGYEKLSSWAVELTSSAGKDLKE